MSDEQRQKFFAILDRGGTVRAACDVVGISTSAGYRWVGAAGLSKKRGPGRIYTAEEKVEFFRLLEERGNVSAVARELGFVRVTCYKWAHQAGIFTGRSADEQRAEFFRLRAAGMSRAEAATQVGTDKRSAHDWDNGIRQFYGGRVYPDGRVVMYGEAEKLANVKRPRRSYINGDQTDIERLNQPISGRFLSIVERERIHDLKLKGRSIRAIGRALGRAPSTISRELARNATKPFGYMPHGAHRLAATRRARPRACKLDDPGPLRDYVAAGLKQQWSPEQISNRMVKDFDEDQMRVCTETIYQAIYRPGKNALTRQAKAPTRTGRTRRKPRSHPSRRTKRFVDPMTPIHQRPPEVEHREDPGHWEGDLIVGPLNQSAVGTVVDRASRFLLLVHLKSDHHAETVRDGLVKTMGPLPDPLRQTLTWDQGAEMSEHRSFKEATGIDVYFCDPASPWQRGTNENTNGLLRQYLPKGTDLTPQTPKDLQHIADELNARPRKALNWDTPAERLQALLTSN